MYTQYKDISVNYSDVSQSDLNIEDKIRANLFAWNGQFSPQFVEVILKEYSTSKDIIFDPFPGSGTTLYEAARKGLPAFGIELNASAYHMAKVYEMINLGLLERWEVVANTESILFSITYKESILPIITSFIKKNPHTFETTLLSALIILLDLFNNELSIDLLLKKWKSLKHIVFGLPYSTNSIRVDMGDARNVPYNSNSATLLLTSPPYINVFNYHQKYRKSVEALEYDVLAIAKTEFGSNRKYRGNRLFTVIQYCIDMALSIKEAIRVCASNSRMIYVVGRESKVLGYSFCNSQLIYEIGNEIFALPFILRQERVFKNRFGQMIYEDILHFSNNKSLADIDADTIIAKARKIAVRMLKEKKDKGSENKNYIFLEEAISKSNNIKESECAKCQEEYMVKK